MALAFGTRLGPYEVVALIGAGGMGEVYRARDTRLKRDVALKILPEEFSADAGRRQRFELEAHAVAALNHPNIVAIYDVGSESGASYIVTEWIDGQPLRAGLSPRKALEYALEISRGLAAAHAAGIIHRDLKPDNILLTADGRVKIVDFGLAKLAPARAAAAASETVTMKTDVGTVLGTAAYMSPEQVRGEEVDSRTDIFSLGVVLYELLSGRRAFQADTSVETMTSILKQDPPDLPETIPVGLRRLVQHCLEKNRENRFQSARDLSYALEAVAQGSQASGAVAAVPGKKRAWALPLAVTVALAGASVAVYLWLSRAPAPVEWTGAMLGGPENARDPRPSPNGGLIAFDFPDRNVTQVGVMKPETGNWTQLTHAENLGYVSNVSWSPDGSTIYYDRVTALPRGIYSVPVLGGDEHLVFPEAFRPEALPDGSLLAEKLNAGHQWQLFRFWPSTGKVQDLPVSVMDANDSLAGPRAFPDGKEAVVNGAPAGKEAQGYQSLLVDLATGGTRPLAPGLPKGDGSGDYGVARDGKSVLVAVQLGNFTRVVSVPVHPQGAPRTLFVTAGQIWFLDGDSAGNVYGCVVDVPADVIERPLDQEQVDTWARFPETANPDLIARLPDGRALVTIDYSGHARLMTVQAGKNPSSMVATTEETSAPVTPLGPREIAFLMGPEPRETIGIAETETGQMTRRLTPGKGRIVSLAASPDGATIYFSDGATVWSLPSAGGEVRKIRAGNRVVASPNGREVLISVLDTPMRLFRVPLDGGGEKEIPADPGYWPDYAQLTAGAMSAEGRLLVSLIDNLKYRPAVLDTATGKFTPLPYDGTRDYYSLAWTGKNRFTALRVGLNSTMWRFSPLRQTAK